MRNKKTFSIGKGDLKTSLKGVRGMRKCLCEFVAVVGCLCVVSFSANTQPLVSFDFNEGSGLITTSSVGNFTGAFGLPDQPDLTGAIVVNDDSPAGTVADKSIQFTGVDGLTTQVDRAILTNLIANPLTVEAWVKVDEFAQTWEDIFRLGNSLKLGFNNGNIVFTTLGVYDWLSAVPVSTGEWHHIAVAWTPTDSAIFYLDGQEVNFMVHAGAARALQNNMLSIGASHTASSMLIGSIDRLRIHSVLLEPDQLDSDGGNPKAAQSSTVIDFNFNDGLPASNHGSATTTPTAGIQESSYQNSLPEFSSDSPTGQAGDYSLYFNGLNARVVVEDTEDQLQLDLNLNFTVEAYVKYDDLPVARSILLSYGVPGAGGYSFSVTNTHTLFVTTYGIKDFNEATDAVIPAGEWHHVAAIHDANSAEMRFYVDGELKTTVPYSGGVRFAELARFYIGMEQVGTSLAAVNPYKGYLDRIRIYDQVIDPSQFDLVEVVAVESWMLHL
jgi:hypothetical protein